MRTLCVLLALLIQGCLSFESRSTYEVEYEVQVPVRDAHVLLEGTMGSGASRTIEGMTDENGICSLRFSFETYFRIGSPPRISGGLRGVRVIITKDGYVPTTFSRETSGFVREGEELRRIERVAMWQYDATLFGFPPDMDVAVKPFADLMSRRGLLPPAEHRAFNRGDWLDNMIDHALARSRDMVIFISPAFAASPGFVNVPYILRKERPRNQRVVWVVLGMTEDELRSRCAALADHPHILIPQFDPSRALGDEALQPVLEAIPRRDQ